MNMTFWFDDLGAYLGLERPARRPRSRKARPSRFGQRRQSLTQRGNVAIPRLERLESRTLLAGNLAFGPPTTFADTGATYAIGSGDFNVDGIVDLATGNYGTSSLNILLGNGDGTFRTPVAYTVGGSPSSVSVGDIDGDGHLDLATGTYSGHTLALLYGRGDGTFTDLRSWSNVYDPVDVVMADMNEDGRLDLVSANYWNPGGSVTIILGGAGRNFQTPQDFASGSGANGVYVADFNEDGNLDVATADYQANTLSILLGDGTGGLNYSASYGSGTQAAWLAGGDFNTDGHVDLAVSNVTQGTLSVFLGDGTGSFQSPATYAVASTNIGSVKVSDVNNDGYDDLLTVVSGASDLAVLLGHGDGTFQNPVLFSTGLNPYGVKVTDFDGNGTLDAATADYTGNSVSVLMNQATAADPHLSITAPNSASIGTPFSVTVTALDSAGNVKTSFLGTVHFDSSDGFGVLPPDYTFVAADNGVHTFTVTLNTGGSQTVSATLIGSPGIVAGQAVNVTLSPVNFGSPTTVAKPGLPEAIASGDFDRDGITDLVIGNYGTSALEILLGNGDGEFRPGATYVTGGYPSVIAVGDLDGDGYLDLATGTYSGQTVVALFGNGDGTFGDLRSWTPGYSPLGVRMADVNGDGMLDLVSANYGGPGGSVGIVLQYPGRVFTLLASVPAGPGAGDIELVDLDGDGDLDAVTADYQGWTVTVLANDGTGNFMAVHTYSAGIQPGYLVAQDFNGDGAIDVAVSDVNDSRYAGGDTVSVLLGNGDTTFRQATLYQVGGAPAGLIAADLNGDGLGDLAVTARVDNSVYVLPGNGDGTFASPIAFATGFNPYGLASTDFDGNGTNDLATANYGGGSYSVILNLATPANPHLSITGPENAQLGASFNVTVTALDSNNAVVTGFTGAVHFRSSDRFATLPPDYTFTGLDNGVHTFQVTLDTRGTHTLSAALVGSPGIVAGTAVEVTPLSFAAAVAYPSVANPLGVASADFNGDGILDLAMANAGSNTVGILRGNGDGTFENSVDYAVGILPYAIKVGDFNGDGVWDLVTANGTSYTVSVLLGNGDGTFHQSVSYAAGAYPDAIAITDFNADGKQDLVTSDYHGFSATVLLGNGDGTFGGPVSYGIGGRGQGVTAGDFNADGKPDVATADWTSNTLSVLLGNGDGTLQSAVVYGTGVNPADAATADLNNDGYLDLVTTNYSSNSVSVFRGNGDGTFSAAVFFPVGASPARVKIRDLNGDGKLDLTAANTGSNNICVLLGNGDGSFQTGLFFAVGAYPYDVTAGDFDGNGTVDLAVADDNSSTVSLLLNEAAPANPHLAITLPADAPLGESFQVTVTARDGNNDILTGFTGTIHFGSSDRFAGLPPDYTFVATENGVHTFNVTLNSGGSQTVSASLVGSPGIVAGKAVAVIPPAVSFSSPTSFSVPGGPLAVTGADFNEDGILDLVTADANAGALTIHLGNGNGSYRNNVVSYYVGGPAYTAVTGDLNNDGHVDLATVTYTSHAMVVLFGNGDGTFLDPVYHGVSSHPTAVAFGYFNNDSLLDIVTANYGSSTVAVFLNSGSNTFDSPLYAGSGHGSGGVAVGDFNGDGKLDAATGNYWANTMTVLLGSGDGTLTATASSGSGSNPFFTAVADLDRDSRLDIVVANTNEQNQGSNSISVFYGNGDGSFRSALVLPADYYPYGIEVADFNQDNILDLLASGSNAGRLSIWLGNGDRSGFQSPMYLTVPSGDYDVYAADVDGNGTTDVLNTNTWDNTVSVLLSQATPADPHLGIAVPASVDTSTSFQITVTALDGANNIASTFTGTVHFRSSDPAAVLPADYTFTAADLGRKDFSVTLNTAGGQTISATLTANPAIVAGALIEVTDNPVGNTPLTADAGGPYVIQEGDSLTLDAGGSSDPDFDSLSFSWDVNGDGIYVDATGVYPTLTWADLNTLGIDDGPSMINVRVRVDDAHNPAVESPASLLTLDNAPPAAGISGPPTGVYGEELTFTLSAADFSATDQAAGFTYTIDWADGSPLQTITAAPGNGAGQLVPHVFQGVGLFNVQVTAGDKDNGISQMAVLAVSVSRANTSTMVVSSVNPSIVNEAVTFTATVSAVSPGAGTPGQFVQFQVDGLDFGAPVAMSNGMADLTTTALPVGAHTITAIYSGDANFNASSESLGQNVNYNFSGFLPPLRNQTSFGVGRKIQIKFQLIDANGVFISSLSVITSLQVQLVDSQSNPLAAPFTPDSAGKTGLRYDPITGQFSFNWSTTGLAVGYYRILLALDDGTLNTTTLQLVARPGNSSLVTDSAGGSNLSGDSGLLAGDVWLLVSDSGSSSIDTDARARIHEAIVSINALVEGYAVTIVEITAADSAWATVIVEMGNTSAVGGYADGVLGCTTEAGEITLIQGWDWYAGADGSAIGSGQFDFQTVVMHELGHALGLGHSSDTSSVMYTALPAGTVRRNLTTADLNLSEEDAGGPSGLRAMPTSHADAALVDWRPLLALCHEDNGLEGESSSSISGVAARDAVFAQVRAEPVISTSGVATSPVTSRLRRPSASGHRSELELRFGDPDSHPLEWGQADW